MVDSGKLLELGVVGLIAYFILKQVGDMGKGVKDAVQEAIPTGSGGLYSLDMNKPSPFGFTSPIYFWNLITGNDPDTQRRKDAEDTATALAKLDARPEGMLTGHPLFMKNPGKIDTEIQRIFRTTIEKNYPEYMSLQTLRSPQGGLTQEQRGLAIGRAPVGSYIGNLFGTPTSTTTYSNPNYGKPMKLQGTDFTIIDKRH